MVNSERGCPICGWDGEIARTYDRKYEYYTHIIERDGEIFKGNTCSQRKGSSEKGMYQRIAELWQ